MSAIIISAHGSQSVNVTNGNFSRTLSIGTNWNHIRIGMLYCFSQSIVSFTQPATLAFGICSGTGSGYGNSTVGNWVGVATRTNVDWTWADNTSTIGTGSFFGFIPSLNTCADLGYRVGSNSFSSSVIMDHWVFSGFSGSVSNPTSSWSRQCIFVEFWKSPPGTPWTTSVYYSYNYFYNNTPFSDITPDILYQEIQKGSPSTSLTQTTQIADGGVIPVSVSESVYGYIDTVNVYWNKLNGIVIDDIAVYRFV